MNIERNLTTSRFQQPVAGDLSIGCVAVTPEATNAMVFEIFSKHRELISLPVLEGERPIGLINRTIFLSQISKPFHKELFDKKSCIAFMDKDPLVVEAQTSIEQLAFLTVASGEKALADGFVIVKEGKFMGLGFGLELMRVIAHQQSEKNRQIMQSIDYASVIQRAMLSVSLDAMSATLPDACLVWEPRDTVGGDFYQFTAYPDGWFAAVADCTGHGVPGAFLTLIAHASLKQALDRNGPRDPAALMAEVSLNIKKSLGQLARTSATVGESNDGMDAAFIWFDAEHSKLTFAGARTPLYVLQPDKDEVEMLDGERLGMGYADTPADAKWSNRSIPLQSGSMVLACTDGIVDQIGGAKRIAFGKRRLREAMVRCRHLSMQALADMQMDELARYQDTEIRRDDVTLFGIRLN